MCTVTLCVKRSFGAQKYCWLADTSGQNRQRVAISLKQQCKKKDLNIFSQGFIIVTVMRNQPDITNITVSMIFRVCEDEP